MGERVDWVDVAKGVCIIMVVMMHSTLGVEKAAGEPGWMGYLVEFARPFRMPDFFLIAGLFLARRIDGPWRLYLDRKVLHFVYFYVLWLTIQFAFKAPGMLAEQGVNGTVREYLTAFVEPWGTMEHVPSRPGCSIPQQSASPGPSTSPRAETGSPWNRWSCSATAVSSRAGRRRRRS